MDFVVEGALRWDTGSADVVPDPGVPGGSLLDELAVLAMQHQGQVLRLRVVVEVLDYGVG